MQEEIKSVQLLLNLLLAFLGDLEGLVLESETEKAWVNEAVEIISELQQDIDSIQRIANRMTRLPYFGNWWAKRQLRNNCNCMGALLRDLFERKVMLGFTFIRRYPPKSVHSLSQLQIFPPQANDDSNFLASVETIRNYLTPVAECAARLRLLSDRFQQVYVNTVGGRIHSRMAWLDQYSKMAWRELAVDAAESLNNISWPRFSAEIDRFFHALEILEISIKACRIELSEETNLVVGFEEDIHKVVSQLTNNNEHCSRIFSVVGMEGIGKTTLAKIIFNHEAIRERFNVFAWVSLTDTVAHENVPKILVEQVLGMNIEWNENEYWIQRLKERLMSGRYILVLDNISTKEAWNNLRELFPETTNGSRIVLTTRNKSVASHADQHSICHQIRLQTKEESWDLSTQMVRFQPELSQEVKTLANKVVGRCGGLPLSILHLGYLMLGKEVTAEELSRALEHINRNQTPWLKNKEINDKELPKHLRPCLSYFAHFPRDYEIPVRRLAALWVAEGLTEHSGEEPQEYVAARYLSELIDRNLIQGVEPKHNWGFKTCGFPSTLRDLCFQGNTKIIPTWSLSTSLDQADQRLVCYFDENDPNCSHSRGPDINSPDVCRSFRNLRSILSFDAQTVYKAGEDIGNFLSRGIVSGHLLQLQVLDLEHVFRPQLPNTIGSLTLLTYLSLRWSYLRTIPDSVGSLVNLQTLDLKHTYIRILPRSVWKLQKLRHLYMNEIHRSKILHKPRGEFLQNLQTLQGAFVDEDSPLQHGLHRLINLRKLKMAFQLNLLQDSQQALVESLLNLRQLLTLKLKSIDDMGLPQNLNLQRLLDLENLRCLYLFGELRYPLIIHNGLPQRLTKLTLSASGLSVDPMPELEKLQNLEWLSFYSDSYIGTSMVCSTRGFPRLQVLKFWKLKKLEKWQVQEKAMPKLKKLEIRSCENLAVPTGLWHLKTLSELKVKDMALGFAAAITNEQIWRGAHTPAIIIDMQ